MRSLKIKIIYFIITMFFSIGFIELGLRAFESFNNKAMLYYYEYSMKLISRIEPYWKSQTDNPLLPPYEVFSNEDFASEARLKQIYQNSRKWKKQEVTAYDFLQKPDLHAQTTYRASFNDLGFRGAKNDQINKSNKTKRIIVYGTYQAFGFGVNDNETYSYLSEKLLNIKSKKYKYQIWNSARPAGTVIVGLAQLQQDIDQYRPDIIIFDYGFVDALVTKDKFTFYSITTKWMPEELQPLFKWLNSISLQSLFLFKVKAKLAINDFYKNSQNYKAAIIKSLEITKALKIPFIFIRQQQNAFYPVSFYNKIFNSYPDTHLINVTDVLQKNSKLENEISAEKTLWLKEINSEKLDYLLKLPPFNYSKFMLGLWQINQFAHQAIANELSSTILSME